jgi:hypothetical protein
LRDDKASDVEVARHAPDHLQLLVVLLAEHRDIGQALQEQLGHHRGDTVEMARPRPAAEAVGEARHRHLGREPVRIDLAHPRREDEIAPGGDELGEVAGEVARVGVEVLALAELRGVDENAGDHQVGARLGEGDEFHVRAVQVAHGRDQADRGTGRAPRRHRAAQLGHLVDHREARADARFRHRGSSHGRTLFAAPPAVNGKRGCACAAAAAP